jgi:hypothetical protein
MIQPLSQYWFVLERHVLFRVIGMSCKCTATLIKAVQPWQEYIMYSSTGNDEFFLFIREQEPYSCM